MLLAINWKLSKCKVFKHLKYEAIFFVYSNKFRYDQRMDAWRDGPSLSIARADFGFVSDGVRLFAIAGGNTCIFVHSSNYFFKILNQYF